MKALYVVLALAISAQAQAQSQSGDAVIVPAPAARYDEATNTVVQVPAAQPAQQTQSASEQNAPIYILNNQRQQSVQEQPTTFVEASPLSDSRAEQMRKRRQNVEVQTEQRIVEKLEEARMEDERARADRLFGNGFGASQPTYAPPAPPVPVVIAPQPAIQAVDPSAEDKISVRSEIKAAMDEINEKPVRRDSHYVGAIVGLAEYPDAKNVKGNVATGLTVGMITADRFIVEGTFVYSDYQVEDVQPYNYSWKDLTQYNFNAAVKYQLLPGKLRPFAGGVVGYTYRKATDSGYAGATGAGYGYGYGYGSAYPSAAAYNGGSNEGTSSAFDVGLTTGLDLQLTDSFAVGGEFRYMTNVSYRRDDSYPTYFTQVAGQTPIEELDYYTITLGGKFTF